jgi:hypothetical protein
MKSCPINYKKIDQNSARILAGLVSTIGFVFILYPFIGLLLVLLYDFAIRILGYEKFSPLFMISRFFRKILKLQKNEVDAGPKQFASKLGLLFVVAAIVTFLLGYSLVATLIIVALVICALLEALFGYCVGCKIYMLLKKFGF